MGFIITITLIALAVFVLLEIPNFNWVNLELKRPIKKYNTDKPVAFKRNYGLTSENNKLYVYYKDLALETLKNLDMEISIKRTKYAASYNQLLSYLTSLVGILGLVIAGFAMISNETSITDRFSMITMVMLIVIPIVAVFFLDLTIKTFILNPMDLHLTVIQKVITQREAKILKIRRPKFIK